MFSYWQCRFLWGVVNYCNLNGAFKGIIPDVLWGVKQSDSKRLRGGVTPSGSGLLLPGISDNFSDNDWYMEVSKNIIMMIRQRLRDILVFEDISAIFTWE